MSTQMTTLRQQGCAGKLMICCKILICLWSYKWKNEPNERTRRSSSDALQCLNFHPRISSSTVSNANNNINNDDWQCRACTYQCANTVQIVTLLTTISRSRSSHYDFSQGYKVTERLERLSQMANILNRRIGRLRADSMNLTVGQLSYYLGFCGGMGVGGCRRTLLSCFPGTQTQNNHT